ncbi:MAG TPA: GNAT family N-acetyltransferase [Terriglobia bacterium]|nr:GNAT family N-acetyltransferase [Terriglobia bacterium]
MPASDAIVIRHCATLEEYQQCVALQRAVWGWDDEDLIPRRFFVVAKKIEGQVIGAFEPSGKMIGFCLAVPAFRGDVRYLHSHMLAVLPEHRRAGVGRRLKLEQRRDALARGTRLIEWTFDPLEWKNAAFNLNRLGAIARRYVPNLYGISSSPLHRGLPTDRLIAEWWLDSPRVAALAEGRAVPEPAFQREIAIPLDILDGCGTNRERVTVLQRELRRQFEAAFGEGLVALSLGMSGGTGMYRLGPFQPAG